MRYRDRTAMKRMRYASAEVVQSDKQHVPVSTQIPVSYTISAMSDQDATAPASAQIPVS